MPKSDLRLSMLAALFLIAGCAGLPMLGSSRSSRSTPFPETDRQDVSDTIFGEKVEDPYRWLEDLEDPAVESWIGAQEEYARTELDALPGREALRSRLQELLNVDSVGLPVFRKERSFYTKRSKGKDRSVLHWRDAKGTERVLLDPNKWHFGESASLGRWVPDPDGKVVAFAVKPNNADEADLHFIEVDTGVEREDEVIVGAKYASPSWLDDGSGFYYTWLPVDAAIAADQRPGHAEVRFHAMGTDPKDDPTIVESTGDPRTFTGCDVSRDGQWLFHYVSFGWSRTEIRARRLGQSDATWTPIFTGHDALADAYAEGNRFYLRTNLDAPRYRVVSMPVESPSPENWTTVIAEDASAVIESVEFSNGCIVVNRLDNASNHVRVHDLAGNVVRDIVLPGIGSVGGVRAPKGRKDLFFSFSSFTIPRRVLRTDIVQGALETWSEVTVPVDPSPYTVEQVWYPSKDGTKVSMFIVRREDSARDGTTPFLLNGYGGFNVSLTPSFSSSRYVWLENGGAFAIPNLRGGGEYGEAWHQAGMLHTKQNTFDDFIAAGEYLIDQGYTSSDRLAIEGGSNGGLLVGACTVQRPDLFGAVICAVPLLDMVRYHLYGSGRTWIGEYGSAEDEAQFRTLYAYSPYHHIERGVDYPAFLMMCSYDDDRVDPMHARKFTAALQWADSGDDPILMRVERSAGHGGGGGVSSWVENGVDKYSFLMEALEWPRPEGISRAGDD